MKYFINNHTYEPLALKKTSRRSYKLWFILLVSILITVLFIGSLLVIYTKCFHTDYYFYNDDGISANENVSKNIYETVDAKKLVCYYNNPSSDNDSLIPSYLEPNLCTHINIAFARICNKTIQTDITLLDTIRNVLKLKEKNANLKVLLSIGGAGADDGYAEMIIDHASRKVFIKSVKSLLRSTKLDGIDLDWEFPAVNLQRELSLGGRQRQHFTQLLREIRMEYIREKRSYLLSVAVAAQKPIVDAAYDVSEMNKYVDFVNIMTYDFHFYQSYSPVTGLNSPLYARTGEYFYMSSLNINSTVHMYLEKGMDRNKIIIGIPTFGHTFTLVNSQNTAIGSPASGYGKLGSFGFVDYPIICEFIRNNSKSMILNFDMEAMVPYIALNGEWVSFDNKKSCIEKANFINNYNFGGAMIYSLNSDDYLGTCSSKFSKIAKFPLTRHISKTVLTT